MASVADVPPLGATGRPFCFETDCVLVCLRACVRACVYVDRVEFRIIDVLPVFRPRGPPARQCRDAYVYIHPLAATGRRSTGGSGQAEQLFDLLHLLLSRCLFLHSCLAGGFLSLLLGRRLFGLVPCGRALTMVSFPVSPVARFAGCEVRHATPSALSGSCCQGFRFYSTCTGGSTCGLLLGSDDFGFPEVGRKFQTQHAATIVSNQEQRLGPVEPNY